MREITPFRDIEETWRSLVDEVETMVKEREELKMGVVLTQISRRVKSKAVTTIIVVYSLQVVLSLLPHASHLHAFF